MSEMIERVTKAIFDEMDLTDGLDVPSAERYAIAAIKALREPTRDMVVAAMTTPYPTVAEAGGVMQQGEAAVRLEWQAMIDAALQRFP